MDTVKKVIKYASMGLVAAVLSCCIVISNSPVNNTNDSKCIAAAEEIDANSSEELNKLHETANDYWFKNVSDYRNYITSKQEGKIKSDIEVMKNCLTQEEYNNAEKEIKSIVNLAKKKISKIKSSKKTYKKYKKYISKKDKQSYKKLLKKIKNSESTKGYKANVKKINKIFSKAKAAKKAEHSYGNEYVQASCYGPYEGETITATGRRITDSTYYIAVPIGDIVSKSTWDKMSTAQKRHHFYYHEVIYLKRGSKECVATVQDCGGFGSYGTTYKGKYCKRQFDLTPAVFHKLGISGVGMVQWHY